MKRLIESLTPARVAIAAIVCVAALGGAAYAALNGSSSGTEAVPPAAANEARPGGAARPLAVDQRLETSRPAVRVKVEKARAKVRRHAEVRKAVKKKLPRPHPVAASESSTLGKARVVKPSVSTRLPRVRTPRRTDRARVTRNKCRRAAPIPKRSDQPAQRTCKSRSIQPPPPPPPPPASQPGDDH